MSRAHLPLLLLLRVALLRLTTVRGDVTAAAREDSLIGVTRAFPGRDNGAAVRSVHPQQTHIFIVVPPYLQSHFRL